MELQVPCTSDALWNVLKIIKSRDSFQTCIKYKVGNGEGIFNWFDHLHPLGPLAFRFGARIMYEAGNSSSSKMCDYIEMGQRSFPHPTAHYLRRVLQHFPHPNSGSEDQLESR